jgi:hypothetical protein
MEDMIKRDIVLRLEHDYLFIEDVFKLNGEKTKKSIRIPIRAVKIISDMFKLSNINDEIVKYYSFKVGCNANYKIGCYIRNLGSNNYLSYYKKEILKYSENRGKKK